MVDVWVAQVSTLAIHASTWVRHWPVRVELMVTSAQAVPISELHLSSWAWTDWPVLALVFTAVLRRQNFWSVWCIKFVLDTA